MISLTPQQLRIGAWVISAVVVAIAVFAWGETYGWRLSRLGIYQIFPLLGLTAFSLMWSHYVAASARLHFGIEKEVLKKYFEITSAVVLLLILLHPGLLAWQLWLDGQGLPPGSELNYVMPSARSAVIIGFVALGVFLAYELRRVYEKSNWWKYMQFLSDFAMILIFIHAIRLGGALQLDWFRVIWYLYGAIFVLTVIRTHQKPAKQKQM